VSLVSGNCGGEERFSEGKELRQKIPFFSYMFLRREKNFERQSCYRIGKPDFLSESTCIQKTGTNTSEREKEGKPEEGVAFEKICDH